MNIHNIIACYAAIVAIYVLSPAIVCVHAASPETSHELDAELGYAAASTSDQDSRSIGHVNKMNSSLKYVVSPQINNNLLVRFGAEWDRYHFHTQQISAVPEALQHINGVFGFDYQITDQWLLRTEVLPGIYGDLEQIDWRNLGVPVIIGAAYLHSADLQWFMGLRIDLRSEFPVLPAMGFRWQLDDSWTVNFQLPKPRLEYELGSKLQLYAGADIKAGTYTVNSHFGNDNNNPRLNGAKLDYTEVRLGPGYAWKMLPTTTLEAEAGYVVWRYWNFFDKGVHLHSDPTPYVQINCRVRF